MCIGRKKERLEGKQKESEDKTSSRERKRYTERETRIGVLQCAAVCCSALQCFTVCCSVLQCAPVYYGVLRCITVCSNVLHCVAVSYYELQCVADHVWHEIKDNVREYATFVSSHACIYTHTFVCIYIYIYIYIHIYIYVSVQPDVSACHTYIHIDDH